MTPKPTKGFAIMLPGGWLSPDVHGSAEKARKYAPMYLPASDQDQTWKHCYKLGYRIIAVDIVPRKR